MTLRSFEASLEIETALIDGGGKIWCLISGEVLCQTVWQGELDIEVVDASVQDADTTLKYHGEMNLKPYAAQV